MLDIVLALSAAATTLSPAQNTPGENSREVEALRAEVAVLREENARSNERIARLEERLAKFDQAMPPQPPALAASQGGAPQAALSAHPTGSSGPVSVPAANPPLAAAAPDRLHLEGDLRARFESNWNGSAAPNRERMVLRARLRGSYRVNSWLTLGGQLVTGDPDDPNSADTTLGNFNDDLTIALDQAYARATFGPATILAGKFPQPFLRTELVWDNDVSPQGVSASLTQSIGNGSSLQITGLYMPVDEAAAGPDSRLLGFQAVARFALSPAIRTELAIGYYDYDLSSTAGGDTGDFRTNRFAGGRYLSDYRLLDIVGTLTLGDPRGRWPIRIVGNYVRNGGATTPDNSGFETSASLGRLSQAGDWRVGYGYSAAGVDAVFAAFSHDNTDLATNYIQHSLTAEYLVRPNVLLGLVGYRYRPRRADYAPVFLVRDWRNRLRLQVQFSF